jgi:DNA polymerase-3 subunit gamma/tau
MLRTHGELGYRQEQRFHLELGLLKMAHAQRLLPIEQLLSDVTMPADPPRPRIIPALAASGEVRRSEPLTQARPTSVSPFAADSARKGNPKAEFAGEPAALADRSVRSTQPSTVSSANVVIMGSAAPVIEELSLEPESRPELKVPVRAETIVSPETAIKAEANAASLRDAVLNALSNQQMLVSMLVEPGGVAQTPSATPRPSSNGSARSRAEQDPIVQRMQEKFGAEIRTVIDYREKG